MSNSEHLSILQQGAGPWNAWRKAKTVRNPVHASILEAELRSDDAFWERLVDFKAVLDSLGLPDEIVGSNLPPKPPPDRDIQILLSSIPDLRGASLERMDLRGYDLQAALLDDVNLREAQLEGADLRFARLSNANLAGARLSRAAEMFESPPRGQNTPRLEGSFWSEMAPTRYQDAETSIELGGVAFEVARLDDAVLNGANLDDAFLQGVSLVRASMEGACAKRVNFSRCDLRYALCSGADFTASDFSFATLVGSKMDAVDLSGCRVHGAAVWDVDTSAATQRSLIITPKSEPDITVDNLEVAQFLYLLLRQRSLREVIDTISSKVVLILGRFSDARKPLLDSIRDQLRKTAYLPVLFDFEKPANRDITETVSTLAHIARFVIADITDARSVPQELMKVVPNLPSVPIVPLLSHGQAEYAMFEHFRAFRNVLKVVIYRDNEDLLSRLDREVIRPAESRAKRLAGKR